MIDLNHTRNLAARPCAGFFVAVLMLGVLLAASGPAQTFTTLHSFTATPGTPATNSDGAGPRAGLIISGNTLYGTANGGGSSGFGTVFAVNTDGTGFTNLHSFKATSATNSDGHTPHAGLILSDNILYGAAFAGGSSGYGTVFAISTNGTGFTNLLNFTN